MRRWISGVLTVMTLVLSGCATEIEPVETSLFAMNTYMTFTVYGENAQEALDESVELIQTMESRWAVTDDESEIYRGNHSDGRPISVSEETAALISFALDMAEKTKSALDPTIYPVLAAWDLLQIANRFPLKSRLTPCWSEWTIAKFNWTEQP